MRRRLLAALLLGSAAVIVLGAGIAAGKFPYFSVDLEPASPRPWEPVTIIVRLWEDAAHTKPATWYALKGPIEDLIEFHGDAGRIPVTLVPAGVAEYRAEVVLSEGDWQLVSFPLGRGALGVHPEGYPSSLTVSVASPQADLAQMGVVAAAVLALAIPAMLGLRRYRRQRHVRFPRWERGQHANSSS
jgi:hypothetical protein